MKQSKSPQIPSSTPKSGRSRISMVLGAIALAAVSYECGQGSKSEPMPQLQSERPADNSGKYMEQCRRAVASLAKRGKSAEVELRALRAQVCQPDEAQCKQVLDSAARDRAFELAGELDIVNLDDIEKLFQAMRKEHTKVCEISADGSSIYLDFSDQECSPLKRGLDSTVYLEEPIEDVPRKYLSDFDKVPKSDDVLAFERQLADGDIEGAVRDFDLQDLLLVDGARNEFLFNRLADLQKDLSNEGDQAARKDLVCKFIDDRDRDRRENDGEDNSKIEDLDETDSVQVPGEVNKDRLFFLFWDALLKTSGLVSEDECLKSSSNQPDYEGEE